MKPKKRINKEIIDFICRAKKATFASKRAKPVKTEDKEFGYVYKEGLFI
ncbi:MAG: hypothetical protein QW273_02460 [Candidatus Pacearchaeota archaeon]